MNYISDILYWIGLYFQLGYGYALDFFLNGFGVIAATLLDLIDFGIGKSTIPPSLQKMPEKSLLTIEETQSEEITINKQGKSTPEQWETGVFEFLGTHTG